MVKRGFYVAFRSTLLMWCTTRSL